MNPATETSRLLEESGAKLVRNGKHKVYKLSNGATFTQAGTPSDHRTIKNDLSALKRALRPPKATEPTIATEAVEKVIGKSWAPEMPIPVAAAPEPSPIIPEPDPVPVAPVVNAAPSLVSRLDMAIATLEVEQETLLARTMVVECRLKLLRHLKEQPDEMNLEGLLKGLLPAPKVIAAPPPPPKTRVMVSRDIVLSTLKQMGDGEFTGEMVYATIMNGAVIEPEEAKRSLSAIKMLLINLLDRGVVTKTSSGAKNRSARYVVDPRILHAVQARM